MELGIRLKQARLALGLSQRQLCGDEITRNMLSQIENGSARPSMDTLRYLAARLGKPVSYFLEEETVTSPNQPAMTAARSAWQAGEAHAVLTALEAYRGRDPVFDEEANLLRYLALTALAEAALETGKKPYAASLLEQAGSLSSIYITAAPEHRRRLLLARATGRQESLPSIDAELLLHARAALDGSDHLRCAALLDGMEEKNTPAWYLLRGRAYLMAADHAAAAKCLHLAEDTVPAETAPLLEICYREMGDYKMAYEYACRQK
ncbi:MAG: helix-turn-helix transcriptional regulator [Oscillospiraceae bacterium]|nr:helix-turn-helix transcriptional regulator [Oscillospiraceae bacterium]